MKESLSDLVAELYTQPPEEFVAVRDEAARRVRASGDAKLAATIGKLRRPTVGAWLVNLLAHQRPDLVSDLLELGDALRVAQRNLQGEELRELSQRRRQAVTELAREAVRLVPTDRRRGNLPVAEVEATLSAALADPEVAEQVRTGTLTKTAAYAGFGETPRPQLRLLQGGLPTNGDGAGAARSTIDTGRSTRTAGAETRVDRPTPTAGKAPDASERTVRKRAVGEPTVEERTIGEPTVGERADRGVREHGTRASREKGEARERGDREREARERQAREREEREERERETAERVAARERAAEERAAARAEAAQLRKARATAHRELAAARSELAEAEAARTAAERAVTAARRRVEKASAAVEALKPI